MVDLTARQGKVKLASGKTVDGYSINGTSPGPPHRGNSWPARGGAPAQRVVKGGVALHWHGVDVPNAQDGVAGVTQDAVAVGEDYTYRWIAPDAGTYWYHSHQLSHEQVSGGLFGGIVIHPKAPTPASVTSSRSTHLYDGTSRPSTATRATYACPPSPASEFGSGMVNTDNGRRSRGPTCPLPVRAVDGFDVQRADEVNGQVDEPPGRRTCRPRAEGARRTAARCASSCWETRPGHWTSGQQGSLGQTAQGRARPSRLRSPARPSASTRPPGPQVRVLHRSRPGFLDGRPGLWWCVNGKLYPDMPMCRGPQGRRRTGAASPTTAGRAIRCTSTATTLSCSPETEEGATGSPWWFDSLEVKNDESLRHRLRCRQPRHLDGPLPQPQARHARVWSRI